MINKKTGEINFSNGITISPNISREEFLSSTISKGSKIFIENEPYCSYRIEHRQLTLLKKVENWIIVFYFYKSKLESIELSIYDKKYGTSWDDWSESKELKKKEFHDKWLMECFGRKPPYVYKWGKVKSYYDQRSASSRINIFYEDNLKQRRSKKKKIALKNTPTV